MPAKRQNVWNELEAKMAAKRTRAEGGKRGKTSSVPHEITVQRLAAEPDSKQTYKPVSPREFVVFDYDELTLTNLKRACAEHFNLSGSTCDVLVSNKGPSCTNINQIPYRKDKVYLVRFVVQEREELQQRLSSLKFSSYRPPVRNNSSQKKEATVNEGGNYPPSVSISTLLNAGMLIKPRNQEKVKLNLEHFHVKNQEWEMVRSEEFFVESEKFSSGAFRNAFKAKCFSPSQQTWVLKTYNDEAAKAINETMETSLEDHTRKQVQMHAAARHIASVFAIQAPSSFGACFVYNEVFLTRYLDKPATIEEFVPGNFMKYVNNNGMCGNPGEGCTDRVREMYLKAQCLVHFSYCYSNKKFMLLDIQGSNYNLYDPEIATEEIVNTDRAEVYFCCGNLSKVAIARFLKEHVCSTYCKSMKLEPIEMDVS